MKYQHLLSAAILGAASAVSASPLAVGEDTGQCPVGYTMTTWVVTVTATPSTTSTPETTVTPTSPSVIESTTSVAETAATPTSPVVVVHSQLPTETSSSTPEGEAAISVSSTSAPTSEASVPESTQVPVETTSSIESSAAAEIAPTSSSTSQETTFTETSTSSAPTSTSTSSTTSTSTQASTSTAQLVSTSSSTSSSGTSGEATFFGGSVAGGTCSFSGYTLPSGLFGAALSVDMWDDASKCGACVAVTGPSGNTIKAMIVDQCPTCATNHFDLFQDAFSELAALSTGVIDITWSYTSCNLDGPLKLKTKAGTSAYWFSMQVVNANEPVATLEVSTDGGSTWQSTTRTYYNYFENDAGFGTDTVDVRVTGESGSSVVVKGVGCASGVEVTADSNL